MRLLIPLLLTACELQKPLVPADTAEPAPWDDQDQDGYVVEDDCDDTRFDVNPAAAESCDGLDNDCDDQTDEDDAIDATAWYADADGDGYGLESLGESCEAPGASAIKDGDCDDGSAEVFPGNEEVAGDGLDNDCDGLGARWEGTHDADEANSAIIEGTESASYAGKAVLSPGDVDGDGQADLLVGAYAQDAPERDSGVTYLFRGPITRSLSLDEGDLVVAGEMWEMVGFAFAAIGDPADLGLNGVAVGNVASRPVYVFTSLEAGQSELTPDVTLGLSTYASKFGSALAGGLDMDDDGLEDLAIGAYDSALDGRGQVYLYRGDPDEVFVEGTILEGAEVGSQAGRALAMGDLDGDGVAELAVGAPYADRGDSSPGEVYLVDSPLDESATLADATYVIGAEDGCQAGISVALPDLDGDGRADLVAGGPACKVTSAGDGMVWIWQGQTSLGALHEREPSVTIAGEESGSLGISLAGLGDVDQDGYEDFSGGAYSYYAEGAQGMALLWYGPVAEGSYTIDQANARFTGTLPNESLGYALSGGRDVTGDGQPDLAVGGPSADSGAGLVRIIPALDL